MNITLFCSSSRELAPVFYSEAKMVGQNLGKNHRLYFGASDQGLMKEVAMAALGAGGEVFGVTTKSLSEVCDTVPGLTELIVCEALSERKKKLLEVADVVLVLPGGIGTLDELFEILAAKQVGESKQKVVLYDCFDFWSGLITYLEQLFEQKMISQNLSDYYTVVNSVEGLDQLLAHLNGV